MRALGKRAPVNRKNKPIQFVKAELKKDEYGDRVPTDISIFGCWSEFFSQNLAAKTSTIGTIYENTVFFNIDEHHRKRVDPSHKIIFDNERYEILDIDYRPTEHDVRITAKLVM